MRHFSFTANIEQVHGYGTVESTALQTKCVFVLFHGEYDSHTTIVEVGFMVLPNAPILQGKDKLQSALYFHISCSVIDITP